MKKLYMIFGLLLLLSGCGESGAFERVEDIYTPVEELPGTVSVSLPEEASVAAVSGDNGTLYICDGFTVAVETLAAGDLSRTVRTVTGFSPDRVTLMQREKDGITAYRCVWTTAGEGGDQVGRCLILDDGAFHYTVTVMAAAGEAAALEEAWQTLFSSVRLHTDG